MFTFLELANVIGDPLLKIHENIHKTRLERSAPL